MKHKERLVSKHTAIDCGNTTKHIEPISEHEYLYEKYTLVAGAELKVKKIKMQWYMLVPWK